MVTTLVAAQAPTSDDLFKQGREAAKRGDYAAACAFFKQSYELDASAGTLFNLAHCQEQLRRVATAWQHYQELSKRLAPGDKRLAIVQERLAALEPRLPRLTLTLAANAPAETQVSLDGAVVAPTALGTSSLVDPGDHTIEVSSPGRRLKRYELIVAESETKALELSPGDPESTPLAAKSKSPPTPPVARPAPREPASADAPKAEPGTDWKPIAGWSLVGLGAAGFVTSGVAALIVLDRKATVEDECERNPDLVCSREGKDAADNGKLWGTIGTVAFIVGAAGVGGGTYLLLTAEGSDSGATLTLRSRF